MEKPIRENLKKELSFDGTNLVQMEYCESSGRYLYKRTMNDGRVLGYEVIKPQRYKNLDGTVVLVYPATAQFGSAGWFLPPKTDRTKIDYYLKAVNKEMSYKDYLKTLK